MKIPQSFANDLWRAYAGQIEIDELIKTHRRFLYGLARFSIRYKTPWYISDEDDMFQEACYWLLHSMWKWDPSQGKTLEHYVVYNIGARLDTQADKERAQKRHPKAGQRGRVEIWDSRSKNGDGHSWESTISYGSSPEVITAIRRALEKASQELTELAQILLVALVENEGNFAGATRDLLCQPEIRRRFGPDEDHLKYVLRRRVLPEIFTFLAPVHIIPSESSAV
jgi:hypothetical protein